MIFPLKNSGWRRWRRGFTWTILSLLTAWVLFCSWFSWWGAREWTRAVAHLEQEHETMDFRKLAVDPVPDESNFCAIPMLKDIALVEQGDVNKGVPGERRKQLEAMSISAQTNGTSGNPDIPRGAALGKPVDLKPWANCLRTDNRRAVPDSGDAARDLLAMLSKDNARFSELAAALNREQSQWTPSWKTRELPDLLFAAQMPHFQYAMGLGKTLCLRSIAAARTGDAALAHESLLVALRLDEADLQEPFLIGMLVSTTQSRLIASSVWELCRARSGSVADFTRLQKALEKCDIRQSALRGFRSELAAGAGALLWLKQSRDLGMFATLINEGGARQSSWGGRVLGSAIPAGFFTSNAAAIVNLELDRLIVPLRDQGLTAGASQALEIEKLLQRIRKNWVGRISDFAVLLTMPAVSRCMQQACYGQSQIDQSVVACALERYRLENGAYPDSLAQLKRADGGPLPLDLYSGKPMSYRKTENGRYALWCIGPDGKNDGGKRKLDPTKPQTTKFHDVQYQGDWVWDFEDR